MDSDLKKILHKAADTIRALSFEGVQKANSGHPGLPMGCAEFGAYLYGHILRHNPKNSSWLGRDRFILSAGHGSMFLYSCLHLAGFKVSMDDLKSFRQLHSITPGHPEYHETDGVETTTGPLGQGVGNAVGQALGLKLLGATFDKELFGGKVFCLAGDGCLMEGVSSEVSSFAGHLCLNNLVLVHDANKITLDGPLDQSSSEDVTKRYEAYGFETYTMNGNDIAEVHKTLDKIMSKEQKKPIYIRMETVIGKGSPNKEGTHKVHGSPLGPEECEATKKALGLPEEDFYVPQPVADFFAKRAEEGAKLEAEWSEKLAKWKEKNPELAARFDAMHKRELPADLEKTLSEMEIEAPIAGRSASQAVLSKLGDLLPYLYGGSADLSGSDNTMMKQFDLVAPGKFTGRNIKYGIREFGMGTMAAGLYQTDMILPFVGTFLTFSDYMRNSVRLAALSHYHTIYQWTHDSIFLGEDGPTHQPIEHVASLRAMPNLHVWRPADTWEVRAAWLSMLEYQGPSGIILTRQKLPELPREHSLRDGPMRGAYILKKEKSEKIDYTLFATGSEVSLAMDVAAALEKHDKSVRVVSMPCWEVFDKQDPEYRKSVVCGELGKRVSIEAGVSQGWHRWIGCCGTAICMEGFGASAPMSDLQQEFGFNVDAILQRIL